MLVALLWTSRLNGDLVKKTRGQYVDDSSV